MRMIDRTTIDKYTEDIAVEGQRIQNELGFVPQYDLAAGWRETFCEMRAAGEFGEEIRGRKSEGQGEGLS